jgi:hypothetical protein
VTKYLTDTISKWTEALSGHEFWDESRSFVPPIRFWGIRYGKNTDTPNSADWRTAPNVNDKNVVEFSKLIPNNNDTAKQM